MKNGVQLQREYYTRTASNYESMHANGAGEHDLACALIHSLASYHGLTSVLDVGSGTGRAVARLSRSLPHARIIGIEPVEALRMIGHSNGISKDKLIDGDATKLAFADGAFDLVCELGILHHIPTPRKAVDEMIRVASKAIFVSDGNRFGQGSTTERFVKLLLWRLGLWPAANWIKTRGKGFYYSEGDGIAYSYSVFDDYDVICRHFEHVMVFNLSGDGKSSLTGSPSIGLFASNKNL